DAPMITAARSVGAPSPTPEMAILSYCEDHKPQKIATPINTVMNSGTSSNAASTRSALNMTTPVPSRFVLEFDVTQSPAFREYRVRRRGQSVDRWAWLRASASHQPCAC